MSNLDTQKQKAHDTLVEYQIIEESTMSRSELAAKLEA